MLRPTGANARSGKLRMKGKDGISRALYLTAVDQRVVLVRVFIKKTRKMPAREINLALKRAKEISPWGWPRRPRARGIRTAEEAPCGGTGLACQAPTSLETSGLDVAARRLAIHHSKSPVCHIRERLERLDAE